jgi:phosphatidylserine decarboxylase
MWILYVLPKKLMSYWVGRLMHLKLPKPMARWAIRTFGNFYQINFDEAERSYESYDSIGDFFVRRLKDGARPIAESPLLHPADSLIAQIGPIQEGRCIQAKGKTYSVAELCGDPEAEARFHEGLFVTYYLCPTDYHRVHSPVDGQVVKARHIPGHLWPVNNWSANQIDNLFAVNERVILEIESRLGPCVMIFVGATNVGQIRLEFDPEIITNVDRKTETREKVYSPPVEIKKGQELGAFYMGSTVVMLYPKSIRLQRSDWDIYLNQKTRVGGALL